MDFRERYGPWAVVAGGSEGVGSALVGAIAARGLDVVLVALDQRDLDAVAATVPTQTRTVVQDLSSPDAAAALAAATADLDVGFFAFVAGTDPNMSRFLDRPLEAWQLLYDRNCASVLDTVHHFAGRLAGRGRGGIALISSGGAWAGASHLAVYNASKAFDLVLAEALWAELSPIGVDVLAMVLSATDTPAFHRIYPGYDGPPLDSPDDVARDLLDHLAEGPTYPPGPSPYAGTSRRDAVQRMSASAEARLHD